MAYFKSFLPKRKIFVFELLIMKKIFTLFIILIFPGILKMLFLRLMGHKVSLKARIRWSLIWTDSIEMEEGANISFFNLIYGPRISMGKNSHIKRLNTLNGPYEVRLKQKASIGKRNKISRGKTGVSYGESCLQLGESAIITSNHYIDLTRKITFGDFSILAGVRSQIWTHGYVHAAEGPGRYRVDGEVIIGKNVYLGSGVIINPGVYINDAINVGGGAVVSKSLLETGMYVSQGLRFLSSDYEKTKEKLTKIEGYSLVEEVYEK